MPEFNASLVSPDTRIHALLVAISGRGKTAAACSFPGKTYILDWDDRAKGAIEGCDFLQEKKRKGDIIINRILPWINKAPQGLKEVYSILEELDTRVSSGEIKNVLCDGTTSMRRFFINESQNRSLNTSGKADSLKHFAIGEAIMAGKPDHNYASVCMTNIIYDILKTFKCNVFLSTHLQDKWIPAPTEEDKDRVISVGQTITAPGQLQNDIPGWFDEVWEFEKDASSKSSPPTFSVIFSGTFARTSFRDLGQYEKKDGKEVWTRKYKLDITGKPLYEVLRPTLERMKAADEAAKSQPQGVATTQK